MATKSEPIISRDPEAVSGELVFAGTRVPVKNSWTTSWLDITLWMTSQASATSRPPMSFASARLRRMRVLLDEDLTRRLLGRFGPGVEAVTIGGHS